MIRVVAAIIERRGAVLVCRRAPDQTFAGQWEFPGGKMRPSESPQAALVRELREELAIEAQIGEEIYVMRHRYPNMPMDVQVRFFRATIEFGEPRNVYSARGGWYFARSGCCFKRIAWAQLQNLPRYDFLAGDRWLVSQIARRGLW